MRHRYAEVRLLLSLIQKFGGRSKFAKVIGHDYFELNNWVCRGYIPHKKIARIGKTIGIAPLILNNRLLISLGYHTWKEEVGKLTLLSKKEINKILNLPLKFK